MIALTPTRTPHARYFVRHHRVDPWQPPVPEPAPVLDRPPETGLVLLVTAMVEVAAGCRTPGQLTDQVNGKVLRALTRRGREKWPLRVAQVRAQHPSATAAEVTVVLKVSDQLWGVWGLRCHPTGRGWRCSAVAWADLHGGTLRAAA